VYYCLLQYDNFDSRVLDDVNTSNLAVAESSYATHHMQTLCSTFTGNVGNIGAGVLSDGASVNITDCLFKQNVATSQGAAIYMYEENATSIAQIRVSKTVFRGNTAQQADGGAVVLLGKAAILKVRDIKRLILL
jgi:predicted outer membrane repeat protein